MPFITANVERGRFDTNGNFLIGYSGLAIGKIHVRTSDSLESNYATYIEDPILNILFGVTNSEKFLMNKDRSNL
ncbi:MAG: hypothetical protein U5K54_15535 [Cytophagales bacterium]|nr:hypothetical protein [Cytophagales bacterium]